MVRTQIVSQIDQMAQISNNRVAVGLETKLGSRRGKEESFRKKSASFGGSACRSGRYEVG